jgi:hypothetical protein
MPNAALEKLGLSQPSDPTAPGPFALAEPGVLEELLADAGFTDVVLASVPVARRGESIEEFLAETCDLSPSFSEVWQGLSEDRRKALKSEIKRLAKPFRAGRGSLQIPGRSLVAAASA